MKESKLTQIVGSTKRFSHLVQELNGDREALASFSPDSAAMRHSLLPFTHQNKIRSKSVK